MNSKLNPLDASQSLYAPFDVINPATEDIICTLASSTPAEIDEKIAKAKVAFKTWKNTDDAVISNYFTAIAADIRAQKAEIAELITREQGKPLFLAEVEVELGASWIESIRDMQIPVETVQENDGREIKIYNKPLGVVASITPWNWPFMIAIWHIFPALKTKNCVINKPSEYTPLSTIRLIEIMQQHLPAHVCDIVLGQGAVGQQLTEHQDIEKVAFTGSTRTGQAILSKSVENLKSVVLELGGNDAAIVLHDVNVDEVAEKIFGSAFLNMGQTCTAIKRLYVHEDIYDDLTSRLAALANGQVVGNGLDAATTFGPIQNAQQYIKVKGLIADALEQGGRVLTADATVPSAGYFVAPTIIADLPQGTALIDEEQFGPVLPVMKFKDIQDVIEQANACQFGLGGSVWTKDLELGQQIADQLETGTVWINRHAQMSPNAPFCGWKMSGLGHAFAMSGLLQFTKKQAVHISA